MSLSYSEFTRAIQLLAKDKSQNIRSIKDFCQVTGYSYDTVLGWRKKPHVPPVAQSWLNLYQENLLLKQQNDAYGVLCDEFKILSSAMEAVPENSQSLDKNGKNKRKNNKSAQNKNK
ncbi:MULTISPECIES: hypothetical protein [Cysteiniphilum]|uniref:Transposase n=1 Tax=Cysteiniphilum litorale TaxID=2056700 RepID=A0A8J3E9E7_9GAMM|nr:MULTISPECIES: hypothetical protein [Cysteiniphilum]GGF98960.1 hypothetical protein GCM10010995_15260 [Cysteiniphilum litorale]